MNFQKKYNQINYSYINQTDIFINTFYLQIHFTKKGIAIYLKNQLQFKQFPTKCQRKEELLFSFFFLRLQPNWKKKWWMLALWWSVINHWVTFQTFSGISNKYFWSIQGVQYTYVDWEYCLVKARFFWKWHAGHKWKLFSTNI